MKLRGAQPSAPGGPRKPSRPSPAFEAGAAPLELTIPCPPSVNSIYRNVAGKGRVKTARYRTWAVAAGNELLAQRRRHISGPVLIDITCERKRSNEDVDNKIKAAVDLLVEMQIIDDDRNVQEVRARWGKVTGAVVRVKQCEEA